PSGDRCGRQCAARRDRQADRAVSGVCGRAGGAHSRALRDERDAQDRRRGPGGADGGTEGACRHRRCGRVRRPRSEVSAVGAGTLPRASREGHRDGAGVDQADRLQACGRSTGMMTGRGAGQPDVAGGPAHHVPVLVRRVVEHLAPRDGGIFIDGTFGAGGYARAILAAAPCRVIALDRDPSAVARGATLVVDSGGRLALVEGRFSNLDVVARAQGAYAVDGVVLDIGVSSMQLDTAERGFSFRLDGPLDMRMGGDGVSAADVVATASERDLAAVISTLGQERHARAVARAITRARAEARIRPTRALADIVARVVRTRSGDIHPATRTFQALRMFVNDELGELAAALVAAERILKPGGRLVVVSFHSLEDRIAKGFFNARSKAQVGSRHRPEAISPPTTFRSLTKRPVVPDDAEIAANPRARSAKLRAGERTDASARPEEPVPLPHLPSLAEVMRQR